MNKCYFIGNICKDPEISETLKGTSVCRFTIAVNRNYGEKETDFFNITAWNKLAESIAKYAHKGDKVCVVGNIQFRSYEDNKGITRTAVDVIAQEVEFLSTKQKHTEEQTAPKQRKQISMQTFDDDGDIPF